LILNGPALTGLRAQLGQSLASRKARFEMISDPERAMRPSIVTSGTAFTNWTVYLSTILICSRDGHRRLPIAETSGGSDGPTCPGAPMNKALLSSDFTATVACPLPRGLVSPNMCSRPKLKATSSDVTSSPL
jgi:hypothetical protein